MEKVQILMKKLVYLGLPILEINKIVTYESWYDYVKPTFKEKTTLCYMDKDNFMVNIKTKYIFVDISKGFEKRFIT